MGMPRRLPTPLRALGHPGFRRYCLGQGISVLGTWIQQVALHWLVYRLTGSAALLGVTAFAAMAPQLLAGPLAGAWIDRHDQRKLLSRVQFLFSLQAAMLALLTGMDLVTPPLIIAMSVLLGVLSAFDIPLRQALIGRLMDDPADLPSALAINGMIFNAGRLVGPPLAGLMIGLGSETVCFAVNALSFLALMVAIATLRLAPAAPADGALRQLLVEGLRHALRDYPVRTLLIAMAIVNLTASASLVLLPGIAREMPHGDAETLGYLWGAAGAGALAAMIDLAWRTSLPRVLNAAIAGIGLCVLGLLLLSAAATPGLALAAMAILGYGMSVANVGIGTLAQTLTAARMRGRVISLLVATRFGFDALGALAAGIAASRYGIAGTLAAAGLILSLLLAWFLAQRRMRGCVSTGLQDSPYGR